jgi:hypothetical protein
MTDTTDTDALTDDDRALIDSLDPDVLAPGGDEDEQAPEAGASETEQAPEAEEGRSNDPLAKVRREAASYRVKLREAEGDRDRLAGVVEGMQRQEAERFAASGPVALASGSDLWTGGVSVEELRAEDGSLDPAKLSAARDRVLAERPHWGSRADDYDGGARQSAPAPIDHNAGLSDALRRAAGQ